MSDILDHLIKTGKKQESQKKRKMQKKRMNEELCILSHTDLDLKS